MSHVIIFDIKRFAVHDGPGIRTTVFMKGCPLRCWWCHNPESQSPEPVAVDIERKVNGRKIDAKKTYGEKVDIGELMKIILRDQHFYQESGGGVTFSGGEPLMQPGALEELLALSKKHGLHTTIDTCGFAKREILERILPLTELFLYDIKNMDPELHRKYTGKDNALILSNADFLLENKAQVIFRIPVVPGVNTSDDEIEKMAAFIFQRRENLNEVHLLPYHRIAENKYLKLGIKYKLPDTGEPGARMMQNLKQRFESTGLEILIGG
ncbi:MAG: glycyl-radical enzyme activating protein [Bacteroidales bacterium]|nr:glycyl-radical enzyme activating protein [Bacteroidales bacterium]